MDEAVLEITERDPRVGQTGKIYIGGFMSTSVGHTFRSSGQEVTARAIDHVQLTQHAWPIAVIIISSIVTIAWVCVLGYGALYLGSLLF